MGLVTQKMAIILWALLLSAPTKPALERGPMDFRCEAMKIFNKPNRTVCTSNVVVRRGTLLLCCNRFEGEADTNWEWQKFFCKGDVKAFRLGELVWAEKAEFIFAKDELYLTGNPLLKRGQSLIYGERAIVDIKSEKVRLEKPRGFIQQAELKKNTPPTTPPWERYLRDDLPQVCPLPEAPKP